RSTVRLVRQKNASKKKDRKDILRRTARNYIKLAPPVLEAGYRLRNAELHSCSKTFLELSVPGADRGPHAGSPRGVVVATGSLTQLEWQHPLAIARGLTREAPGAIATGSLTWLEWQTSLAI